MAANAMTRCLELNVRISSLLNIAIYPKTFFLNWNLTTHKIVSVRICLGPWILWFLRVCTYTYCTLTRVRTFTPDSSETPFCDAAGAVPNTSAALSGFLVTVSATFCENRPRLGHPCTLKYLDFCDTYILMEISNLYSRRRESTRGKYKQLWSGLTDFGLFRKMWAELAVSYICVGVSVTLIIHRDSGTITALFPEEVPVIDVLLGGIFILTGALWLYPASCRGLRVCLPWWSLRLSLQKDGQRIDKESVTLIETHFMKEMFVYVFGRHPGSWRFAGQVLGLLRDVMLQAFPAVTALLENRDGLSFLLDDVI